MKPEIERCNTIKYALCIKVNIQHQYEIFSNLLSFQLNIIHCMLNIEYYKFFRFVIMIHEHHFTFATTFAPARFADCITRKTSP